MRLCTHSQTPCPKMSRLVFSLFIVNIVLWCFVFALASFACFYYAKSILGGVFVIVLPAVLTILVWVTTRDMSKAYVEIDGNAIRVVDYYFGFKKEKTFPFSAITSAEIVSGSSLRVKGYRYGIMGIHYIIFKRDKKYLFKIICLPETEKIFKRFLV